MTPNLVRHAEIRDRLRSAGSSISDVARELGVAHATVTIVSQGHRRSHRIQSALANKLGLEPIELFPERYAAREGTMT